MTCLGSLECPFAGPVALRKHAFEDESAIRTHSEFAPDGLSALAEYAYSADMQGRAQREFSPRLCGSTTQCAGCTNSVACCISHAVEPCAIYQVLGHGDSTEIIRRKWNDTTHIGMASAQG